jgi:hypothetical protein
MISPQNVPNDPSHRGSDIRFRRERKEEKVALTKPGLGMTKFPFIFSYMTDCCLAYGSRRQSAGTGLTGSQKTLAAAIIRSASMG